MPKWIRILLIALLSLLALIILVLAGASYYVHYHKQDLLHNINQKASETVQGNISIGDLDLWIWKEFPSVSLRLHDVKVTDSLFHIHNRPLLDAQEVYLKLDVTTLLHDEPDIKKIIVNDALAHIFIDSNEYTNTYLLKSKKPKDNREKKLPIIDKVRLERVHFLADLVPKDKQFDILIHDLDASIDKQGKVYSVAAPLDIHIGMLGFRMSKGPFMVDQPVKADTRFAFHTDSLTLHFPKQMVYANDESVMLGMDFDFTEKPGRYKITIQDDDLNFQKGVKMLNHHIAKNFNDITATRPLKIDVFLDGGVMLPDTPIAIVKFSTEHNTLVTKYGTLSDASFSGHFTNKYKDGIGLGDDNSIVFVEKVTASYDELPFRGDSILVHDIKNPYLTGRVRSQLDVRQLNEFIGKSIRLDKGTADIDLRYRGLVMPKSPGDRSLDGYIKVRHAKANYLPREMNLDKVNADLVFRDKDLIFQNISVVNGRSDVNMSGVAKNFLTAFFVEPEMVMLHFDVHSRYMNMDDFDKFVIPRKAVGNRNENSGRKFRRMNHQLDNLLDRGNMVLDMKVDKLVKDKFVARNLRTKASLLSNVIRLDNIAAQFDKGSLAFQGTINQNQKHNPFNLKGKISNIDIDKLFYAFDDFGLAKLKSENINGLFNADIDLNGNFTDDGKLITRSLRGVVDFNVQEGSLMKLPALQEIKKYVFKKRDLDNIRFHTLANKLFIEDGKVIIHPMGIETSAINIYTKGIYSFYEGTDISIEIPIRNPAKDSLRIARGLSPNPKAGLKVILRAYDDEDGKVTIRWDPRRKGEAAIDAALDIDEDGELVYDDAREDPNIPTEENVKAEIPTAIKDDDESSSEKNFWQKLKVLFKMK